MRTEHFGRCPRTSFPAAFRISWPAAHRQSCSLPLPDQSRCRRLLPAQSSVRVSWFASQAFTTTVFICTFYSPRNFPTKYLWVIERSAGAQGTDAARKKRAGLVDGPASCTSTMPVEAVLVTTGVQSTRLLEVWRMKVLPAKPVSRKSYRQSPAPYWILTGLFSKASAGALLTEPPAFDTST